MPAAWTTIRTAPLALETRATRERIFECWLMERLPTLTDEELRTMLPALVPLEQTRAYKDMFAKGEAAGKIEGKAEGKADGKAESLKFVLSRRFGRLPTWALRRLKSAGIETLDDWFEQAFDTPDLETLLGPAPPGRRGKTA